MDRLNSIVEDLLALARIEQKSEQKEINFEPAKIVNVCQADLRFFIDLPIPTCYFLATNESTISRPLVGSQQHDQSCHSFYGNPLIFNKNNEL